MHNYTIKKSKNHGMVLEKDGAEAFCPFQSPLLMPIQNNVGGMGMTIVRMPCGTHCPHSKLIPTIDLKDSSLNHLAYHITCNGTDIKFSVTESEDEQQPAEKKPNLIVT